MTDRASHVVAQLQTKIQELEAQLGACQSQIERLTASEARFRAIAEHASDTIATIAHTGEVSYLSPNVQTTIGFTPSEIVGQVFTPFIHPDDLPDMQQIMEQVLTTGAPYTGLEYRVRHKQGHYVWHSANLSTYRDATGQPILIAIGRDATQQKATEAALAKSQAQFEAILQNANVAIFAKDLAGRYIFANPWVSEEVGLPIEQILGKTDADLLPPDIAEQLQANDRLALETGQATRTEEIIASPHGETAYLAIKFPLLDQDGRPYAVCGISTNITDLKRTEAALRESEAKLNRILDNTSATIATYRVYRQQRFIPEYVSSSSLELWGFTPEDMLASLQPWLDRFNPDDLQRILAEAYDYIFNERPYNYEFRYHHPDGSLRWLECYATSYRDEAENCWRTTMVYIDISDRKRLEEELRQSEAKFRRIVENASDVIITVALNGTITYVSPIAFNLFGYTSTELIGTHAATLVYPDDLHLSADTYQRVMETGEPHEYEHRILHRDGSIRYVVSNVSLYQDEHGNSMMLAIVRDITDRKRLEEELRQSEAKFRRIVENASDLIATATPDGALTYISPNVSNLLGYSNTELIGNYFAPIVHPDDVPLAVHAIEQAMTTGTNYEYETRLVHRDGSLRYVISNVSMYEDENSRPMLLSFARDITDRKRLEEELRQSEAKFRAIVENANDTIATVNTSGIITYLSPNMLALFQREASELLGTSFEPLVHPEDVPKAYASIQQVLTTGEPYQFEYRIRRWDGEYRYFVTNTSLFYNEHGEPMILGISRDVTEQKRLEAELRQSEYKFRAIVENANDMIYLIHPDGTFAYMSPNVHLHLGYTAAELQGQPFTSLVHPDDLEFLTTTFEQVLAGETMTLEARGFHRDGSLRWFSCQVSQFHGPNGEVLQMGIARNITENKRLEEELRQSEAKFRTIVEQANDIIYTINQAGITTYISPNIQTILGTSIDTITNNQFDIRVHPDDLGLAAAAVRQALSGEKSVLECRALHQDGSIRWLNSNLAPIRAANGEFQIMGIARDITDRKHLEEELRQSEYKFRAIVENANDMIYVIDASGHIVYMSPNSVQVFGYSATEMEGQTFDRFVYAEDLAIGADAIQRAIAGERVTLEARYIHKNGSIRWSSANVAPFLLPTGETALMGISRDIHDRKQLEEELRQSEYKFRAIVENANDLIYVIDGGGRILYMSPNSAAINGFNSEEMEGRTFDRFVYPDDLAIGGDAIGRAIAGEKFSFELRSFHKNGSVRWFSSNISPFQLADGTQVMMGIGRDVTDRKRLEEDLRQSQQFLNSVIENIPLGFFAKDVRDDYRYVLINKGAEQFIGFSREQGIGCSDYELLPKVQADYYRQQDQTVVQARSLIETPEVEITTTTGERLLARVIKFPLFDDQGNLTHLLCLNDDITERKQREEELRLAKEAAEAANRAKSVFLANMSHELRTPLNVILGFTQLMERENALSDRQRNFITTINRSGEHLLNLINDVLEMSKIEAGRITLNPEPFDLRHLLHTLQEMFRIRAEAKGLSLTFQIAPNLPPSLVADEGKLRQVLINLLSNAVKFTERGNITLSVEFPPPSSLLPTPHLLFTITDTGIGIAPGEVEQLFQPFVQTASGLQVKEGTGLGLTISRQFVQLMGGDIHLESVVGQGSTFTFQIPVTLTNTIVTSASPRLQQVLGLVPGQPTYRLLIVDDRADNRNLLTHLLQSFGFATQTANNGQDAIALWQTWHPHLIWMDMRMPIMDGYEATRQIRALEADRRKQKAESESSFPLLTSASDAPLSTQHSTLSTKIIALTASAFEEQRTTILAAGCDDFVRKPFREQVIFDKLTEHLGVQFIYAEPETEALTAQPATGQQPIATIHVMPPEWIQALQQAAIAIDSDRLLQLVADIPPQHAQLAEQLTDLIRRFCFDEILDLITAAITHD
ncbi:MAG: PAS domain S-box protein [Leptolyngbyaceae cyanobacterium bins.349]|nr:PAS domain S-box protein [Leptolyngbyaceae cyanobacterium bins.349]